MKLLRGTVQSALRRDPEQSLADFAAYVDREVASAEARRAEQARPCANCGYPVVPHVDSLRHVTPSGVISNIGCHAASWDRRDEAGLEGWDDKISKGMNAK